MSIHHQSALNNRPIILEQLRMVMDRVKVHKALEVASGTGAHIELFGEFKANRSLQ